MTEVEKLATASLRKLIEQNPAYSIDSDPPQWLFGTNHITFGKTNGKPVVFKYFNWPPRKTQEETALRLFAPTGLVPKLFSIESETILVMERFEGSPLNLIEQNAQEELLSKVYYQLGEALGHIVTIAPGSKPGGRRDIKAKLGFDYEFFTQASTEILFNTVIDRANEILTDNSIPESPILSASLALLQQNRDAILTFPTFVQMDDFHTNNIIVNDSHLKGFIDLEMSRYGNEVLVLASALAAITKDVHKRWQWLIQGYENRRGYSIDKGILNLVNIAAPFTQWIRFMWYWTTDPNGLEEGITTRGWPIRDIKAITNRIGVP